MAAALAKGTAGGGGPHGMHHRQFVALDFLLHLAHGKFAMPGIDWNSLPRCRRSVDGKPHRRLVCALGRRKMGPRPWNWDGLALKY